MTERFTTPRPEDMSPEQRAVYDLFASGRRAASSSAFSLVDASGRLQGPPAAWVLHPPLGSALERLGAAIRYELTLPARLREMVILMVGHHHRSPFEVYAHVKAGAAAGLSPADLDALAGGRRPDLMTGEERTAYDVTRQLLDTGGLGENTYAEAVVSLTVERLFELVTLVAYYSMVAIQLAAFDLLPPEETDR
ncbi:carboxymuconolactone decarboxylase family protein [Actinoallomurus acaciae]|uniref:Carboxymuconolactone decarboxylase family protein n=1 Tax=Actinoallomurus acaciae TaxID=502577 RepID=A0ABV5YA48_9ACTN